MRDFVWLLSCVVSNTELEVLLFHVQNFTSLQEWYSLRIYVVLLRIGCRMLVDLLSFGYWSHWSVVDHCASGLSETAHRLLQRRATKINFDKTFSRALPLPPQLKRRWPGLEIENQFSPLNRWITRAQVCGRCRYCDNSSHFLHGKFRNPSTEFRLNYIKLPNT